MQNLLRVFYSMGYWGGEQNCILWINVLWKFEISVIKKSLKIKKFQENCIHFSILHKISTHSFMLYKKHFKSKSNFEFIHKFRTHSHNIKRSYFIPRSINDEGEILSSEFFEYGVTKWRKLSMKIQCEMTYINLCFLLTVIWSNIFLGSVLKWKKWRN